MRVVTISTTSSFFADVVTSTISGVMAVGFVTDVLTASMFGTLTCSMAYGQIVTAGESVGS